MDSRQCVALDVEKQQVSTKGDLVPSSLRLDVKVTALVSPSWPQHCTLPCTAGNLCTPDTWLDLLDGLPHVKTIDLTCYPETWTRDGVPMREVVPEFVVGGADCGLLACAAQACEQRNRWVRTCKWFDQGGCHQVSRAERSLGAVEPRGDDSEAAGLAVGRFQVTLQPAPACLVMPVCETYQHACPPAVLAHADLASQVAGDPREARIP
jgi:hypothetical protein